MHRSPTGRILAGNGFFAEALTDETELLLEAPQSACISNPGDFYTMTDTLRSSRLPLGGLKASAGLGLALRLGRMYHRICGKKTMEVAQVEPGDTVWASSVVAGGQQFALREQCPGSLVEVTGGE